LPADEQTSLQLIIQLRFAPQFGLAWRMRIFKRSSYKEVISLEQRQH
jgi:hypothetical protein